MSIIEDVYNVLKTMEFCNKGMVQADPLPPPPVMVKDHIFYFFFWDPSLRYIVGRWLVIVVVVCGNFCGCGKICEH